jgi:hypothetical protein
MRKAGFVMSHRAIVTLTATAVVLCGFAALALFEPFTLVRTSFRHRASTFDCRIVDRHGNLSASVSGPNGALSIQSLGRSDEVGTDGARIAFNERDGRVEFEVGRAGMSFDLESRSFAPLREAAVLAQE